MCLRQDSPSKDLPKKAVVLGQTCNYLRQLPSTEFPTSYVNAKNSHCNEIPVTELHNICNEGLLVLPRLSLITPVLLYLDVRYVSITGVYGKTFKNSCN